MTSDWTNHDEAQARIELLETDLKIIKDYYEKREYSLSAIRLVMNLMQDAKLLYRALEGLQKGEKEWKPIDTP